MPSVYPCFLVSDCHLLNCFLQPTQPEYFYFEVVECVRRLSLASIIGIVAADSAASPVIGLCISLAFNYVFTSLEPFNRVEANIFSIVLSYSLTLFFLAGEWLLKNEYAGRLVQEPIYSCLNVMMLHTPIT
jgi:hypothetical protein